VTHGLLPALATDTPAGTGPDLFAEMRIALTAERARANAAVRGRAEPSEPVELDQRDVLLDKLSSALGSTSVLHSNGTVDVTVDGQSLVSGNTAVAVAYTGGGFTVGGTAVTLTSGSASADLAFLATTMPGYQSALDAVATKLMTTVNNAQSNGYDLNSATGAALFAGSGAGDVAVAFTDPRLIAAASAAGGPFDGNNALAVAGTGALSTGPDAEYVQLVAGIAGDSAVAQAKQVTQATVTQSVDALRTSVTGVSYDEEVNNMLTYQHAYQAASRVLTTIDDMLDTLINHTGLVGRA
jgi:flagellar hook-associated protein 1 FlgK